MQTKKDNKTQEWDVEKARMGRRSLDSGLQLRLSPWGRHIAAGQDHNCPLCRTGKMDQIISKAFYFYLGSVDFIAPVAIIATV